MSRCPNCYAAAALTASACHSCGRPMLFTSVTPSPGLPPYTESQSQPSARAVTIQVTIVFVFLGLVIGAVLGVRKGLPAAMKRMNKSVEASAVNSAEGLREQLLGYMAQPNYSGFGFEEQVLGRARLELRKADDGEVWFSLPNGDNAPQSVKKELQRFVIDTDDIEIAREINGLLHVGGISLDKREDRAFLFKTSENNIRFDPAMTLTFEFQRGNYTVTLKEAVDYLSNNNAQGGNLQVRTGRRENGREFVFLNHGAMVAKKGEPSLMRFVETLTSSIAGNDRQAREKKIQRLLDFVTDEITYDTDEANSAEEILKHPVETLISHEGDCSNKSILFASLLEQLGEDYLFLYLKDHITVAVRQEGFSTTSGLVFGWSGKTWSLAETTVPKFKIGETRLRLPGAVDTAAGMFPMMYDETFSIRQQDWLQHSVEFVQRPKEKNVIINVRTGERLNFL